eukprot:TRINITY_DN9757_c0_g1_i1.p1 TRINITY_DN9757_c0_g1~~TRINITY_DN9757_c0_g1_i1.p1  ORF type:complete len:561 (-),score=192.15 TRINITY_DN9757_c0_g1_i1:228-1910(-)
MESLAYSQQSAAIPAWKANFLQQVKQRNMTSDGFRDIFQRYTTMSEGHRKLQDKFHQLEVDQMRLTQLNTELLRKVSASQSSEPDPKLLVEFERRVQKLQEELAATYKRSADSANTIIELNARAQETQDLLHRKDEALDDWARRMKAAEQKCRDLMEAVEDRDRTREVLQDELKSINIQVTQMEAKCKSLTAENEQLLQRWIRKMQEEAEKMNDSNALFEELQAARAELEMLRKMNPIGGRVQQEIDETPVRVGSMTVPVPKVVKKIIEAHKGDCNSIAYSARGSMLASGGNDNVIRVWETRSCTLKATLNGSTQSVMCVAFSHDDENIVGASNDNAARLWNLSSGRIKTALTGHQAKVVACAFSGDSQKVITGSQDRTVKVWDLAKGYCIRTIFCLSSCNALAVSADARMICSGHFSAHVRFWDTKSGEMQHEMANAHSNQVTSVTISPDGEYVLTAGRDHVLSLIDVRTYGVVKTFTNENYRNGVNWSHSCFSPDGRYVVGGSNDGAVFIWNVNSGRLETTLKSDHNATVMGSSWSPGGSQLATSDKGGVITIWGSDN